jgi:hypothetical protein
MIQIPRGVRFSCQRCGRCCTGEPGTIYVAPGEIPPIATCVGIPVADLKRSYLYPFRDGYSIKEDEAGNCLFYASGCLIYPARPMQCRCFPFWRRNLSNPDTWREVEQNCPGIGRGPMYSEETIRWIARSSPL